MTESVLDLFIRIQAYLAVCRKTTSFSVEKTVFKSFLLKNNMPLITKQIVEKFEIYYNELNSQINDVTLDALAKNIQVTVQNLLSHIAVDRRLYLLSNLLEITHSLKSLFPNTDGEFNSDILIQVSKWFYIDEHTFHELNAFILGEYHTLDNSENMLVVSGQGHNTFFNLNNYTVKEFKGVLYVLSLHSGNLIIKYHGNEEYKLNGRLMANKVAYIFTTSSVISGSKIRALFFTDFYKAIKDRSSYRKILLKIQDLEFSYKGSKTGIKKLNFQVESNELIGVIGGSGSGKSTLLNLLVNELEPDNGKILVNNESLRNYENPESLIGFVPQDDVLNENLSVFDNLYFSTKLSLSHEEHNNIKDKCYATLKRIGLYEARHLKVGSPFKKVISGGQRKRLNIALDIIRKPPILLVDEPTSGLSSSDSKKVIGLLKQHALDGNIVITNVHQPSDELFYIFDKVLILDKEGHTIYFGRPGDALSYFNDIVKKIDLDSGIKQKTEAEEILSIVEETKVDKFGNQTDKRIREPKEFYEIFYNKIKSQKIYNHIVPLKLNPLLRPIKIQFYNFFKRQLKARLSNPSFILMSFLAPPVLAFILAGFSKEFTLIEGSYRYVFANNSNIPVFYFMSTLVAIFLGLIISAQEIFTDRVIQKREKLLRLNQKAYYLSKIIFLCIVSLIQCSSYLIISIVILKLTANLFTTWLTLYLLFVLANIMGLILSGLFNSIVAIYIAIPILIIPQILLSGVVVNYSQLHPMFSSEINVPFVGNIIPIRWSNEVLLVNQYVNNKYQKQLFKGELLESRLSFVVHRQIPFLLNKLQTSNKNNDVSNSNEVDILKLIQTEVPKIHRFIPGKPDIVLESIDDPVMLVQQTIRYLKKARIILLKYYTGIEQGNEAVLNRLKTQFKNSDQFTDFKSRQFNEKTADIVLNRKELKTFFIHNSELFPAKDILYSESFNKTGKAPLYIYEKKIFQFTIKTTLLNNLVILFITIILITVFINEWHLKLKVFNFKLT